MPRALPLLLFLVALSLPGAVLRAQPEPIPAEIEALLAGPDGGPLESLAGFHLTGARVDESLRLYFRATSGPDAGKDLEIRLQPRDETRRALVRTPSFNLGYVRAGGVAVDEARAVALTRALAARIRPNDPGGLAPFRPASPAGAPRQGALPPDGPREDPLSQGLIWATRALLALWLVSLGAALAALRRSPPPALGGHGRRVAWAVGGATLVGIAARWLAPDRLVMHYMGYEMTAFAADLATASNKYGPASFSLYYEIFRWTGVDHAWLIQTNRVLGALLPPLGALVLARLGAGAGAAVGAAWLVALLPLLVKDATTESILLPMQAWLLLGTAEALRFRATGSRVALAGASATLLLAMLARPEALLLVPLTAGALVALGPHGGSRPRAWLVGVGVVASGLLVARGLQLHARMAVERALGNTPQVFEWSSWTWIQTMLWEGLFRRDALFWAGLVPPALTGLALLAPLAAPHGQRRRAFALLAAALAWIVVSRLDLPYLSIPRVQAPGVLLASLAAAMGVAGLAARTHAWPPLRRRLAGGLLVTLLASGAWATLPDLWLTTHADEEEALIREALTRLPAGPVVVHRRSHGDEPNEPVHLQFPDYLLRGRARGEDMTSLTLKPPVADGPRHVVVLGTRCFLRACDRADEHPACAAVRTRYRLLPLVERDVPPQGFPVHHSFGGGRPVDASMQADLDFPWCRPREGFRIGVYEVLP